MEEEDEVGVTTKRREGLVAKCSKHDLRDADGEWATTTSMEIRNRVEQPMKNRVFHSETGSPDSPHCACRFFYFNVCFGV